MKISEEINKRENFKKHIENQCNQKWVLWKAKQNWQIFSRFYLKKKEEDSNLKNQEDIGI